MSFLPQKETARFVKIKDCYQAKTNLTDDYSNKIAACQDYIEYNLLERSETSAKGPMG